MFWDQVVNCIVIGSTYALVALGYNLVFGVMKLLNLSHGEVYTFGAFAGYLVCLRYTDFFTALAAGAVISALLGLFVERLVFRPLREAPGESAFISSIGAQTLLQNLLVVLVGPQYRAFPAAKSHVALVVGKSKITTQQILMLSVVLVLMVMLSWFVYRTKYGLMIRAMSFDRQAAIMMGIDTIQMTRIVFALASALAGCAAVLMANYYGVVYPTMGSNAGLKAFVAAVIGGRGSIPGAVVGGFILAMVEGLGGAYLSTIWRNAIAFATLAVMLIVRPAGLLPSQEADRV